MLGMQTEWLGVICAILMLLGHWSIQQFNNNLLNTYYVLSAKNIAGHKQAKYLLYRANILYKAVTYTLNNLLQNTRKLTTEL